ncbi:hypothetical protein RhiirA1_460403 [Rhizophagus irregularis]|uniref:Uncharacterized protein n=1 Tax=Rhizophagus irregularis TaxID=588596 RepID=A0A2N0RRN6_9GLOM|nr:hypothetical protein RhiirA1_460403 [Rhizophagus irregularis]GET57856.1 hypothetical protein RIR_jg41869.t1 [Rhizophagus irregularis DAOM 181602=DAOM 197198]
MTFANDPLDPIEAEWISDAMMGGLIWADNEWKGYGRQYDGTSLYPSIQQSNANFPIRQVHKINVLFNRVPFIIVFTTKEYTNLDLNIKLQNTVKKK